MTSKSPTAGWRNQLGLELAEEHSERGLEQALVRHLRNFLPEMGNAFAFVGNQYRLEGENPPIGIIICRSKDRTNSVIENHAPAERRIADIQAS